MSFPVLAAASALGNLVSNVASSIISNNTNKKISSDTNAQNYKIWQESLAAQREQYEKEKFENRFLINQQRAWSLADRDFENQYNSPAALRQRLEQAGINPAFAMSNGQGLFGSSTAETSTGSPPSASVPAAPEMRGYTQNNLEHDRCHRRKLQDYQEHSAYTSEWLSSECFQTQE